LADKAIRQGAARVRTYVIAVLLASFLFAAFDTFVRYAVFNQHAKFQDWWIAIHPISQFMWFMVVGGFTTFVYADLRRNRESAAQLQAATLKRAQTARDALQTRLQAMQARVEPQFLFDTLERIGHIYERDQAKGQQTIDDLIIYLRTAMPQMHDSGSTLARELDLVRTYTAVVAACSGDRVRLDIESTDDWSHTAFPPMLLLPLIEHAIGGGRMTHTEDRAIALHANRADGKLRIIVGHGGQAFAGENGTDTIARIREHLHTLFDAKANIERRTRADRGSEVVMEIPA
jgi:LytS/YehU family sensor histidine kinase